MAEEKKNGATPPPKIVLSKPRPPVAPVGKPKSDTSRVDLAASQPMDLSKKGGEPLSIREVLQSPETPKSATSRISLSETQSFVPGDSVPVAKVGTGSLSGTSEIDTSRMKLGGEGESAEKKSETVRVDLTGMVSPDQPSGTAPISVVPEASRVIEDASKNRTARISIDVPTEDDAVRMETGVVPTGEPLTPAGAPPPKTVRLTRPPAALPKTVVLKRPETSGTEPRTVVLKRPDERLEEKGATARIAIPEATAEVAPPTQRKTIRIKRSGGPAGPALPAGDSGIRIARTAPTEEEGETALELANAVGAGDSCEPGVFFALLSIAATLILGVLVYILLQQTYFPDWSWPGKLVDWSVTSQQATIGLR
ncbi:MAG: hypothetical protein KBA51_02855 [Kiritimatiellae bacterium]|nr:hypothetical protein [Kiritimatiellia bacterium]